MVVVTLIVVTLGMVVVTLIVVALAVIALVVVVVTHPHHGLPWCGRLHSCPHRPCHHCGHLALIVVALSMVCSVWPANLLVMACSLPPFLVVPTPSPWLPTCLSLSAPPSLLAHQACHPTRCQH